MDTTVTVYPDTGLFVNNAWRTTTRHASVVNPATEREIGRVSLASREDLADAAQAARDGFAVWRRMAAYERAGIMREAARLLRERADAIASMMTQEQGKPLAEARIETLAAADTIEWFAEEGRRAYGRVVAPRAPLVRQIVTREPVGPVAAFTPWNFPVNQAVRKIAAALSAGCSVVLKGPEETPASCAALVLAFADAGVPAGVLNLVFGVPAEVSDYLIAHPAIRKISFTGSTEVGKLLASKAGLQMKRVTMELGGHAPAIVFADSDIANAAKLLAGAKFRNAGQVCISPTRFLVQASVHDEFVEHFCEAARTIAVGNGLHDGVQMGPLANMRRLRAMEQLTDDALAHGAKLVLGGRRLASPGYFFAPTVLTHVPTSARIMNEEPFGPIVPISSFEHYDDALAEANRLPFGLAAYAYTDSGAAAHNLADDLECGMVSINHHGLGLPELPFGGVKDSGYGSEGGPEALEGYLATKIVSERRAAARR